MWLLGPLPLSHQHAPDTGKFSSFLALELPGVLPSIFLGLRIHIGVPWVGRTFLVFYSNKEN